MYKFWGKVRKGKNRGKELGFPTANINLRKQIPDGVYLSEAKVHSLKFPSLTFIGKAETFNETKYQAEVYILDFSHSLYDKILQIKLLKKIRESKKFKSKEALIKQMKDDENVAKAYFKEHKVKLY